MSIQSENFNSTHEPLTALDARQLALDQISVSTVEGIESLSYEERYVLIRNILAGVNSEFPAPSETSDEPIDESLIPAEIDALNRVIKTLTLSDEYKDFVCHVTKQAALELCENTHFVRDLLNWNNLSINSKLNLCQEFHDTIMEFAKLGIKSLKYYDPFSQAAQRVRIEPTNKFPLISGNQASILHGFANIDHQALLGCHNIFINVNRNSALSAPDTAMNVVAHETAHRIEGLLAFVFNHHKNFVPPEYLNDAELLFNMWDLRAYVTPRICSVYPTQGNEKLADQAGQIAEEVIANKLAKTTRLALS